MGLEEFYGNRYKLDKSEKFDDFLKALGVGLATRKIAGSVSPTIELTESNGTYTLKTTSTFKNTVIHFKPGETFDETTPDGRKVKSTVNIEGNKLVQWHRGKPKDSELIREFFADKVIMTCKVDDIVSTRTYKLVK